MMLTLLRIVVLLMGGFAFGLTLIVSYLYVVAWRKLRTNGLVPPYHVPVIGLSHMVMIGVLEAVIISRIHHASPFALWLAPLAAVGFALTIFALVQAMRSPRLRGIRRDVEAHAMRSN